MQLRFSAMAFAAVIMCSSFGQAGACGVETVFVSAAASHAQVLSEERTMRMDVEDESVSSYLRELATEQGITSAIEISNTNPSDDQLASEIHSGSVDVEGESVSSYMRELLASDGSSDINSASNALDALAIPASFNEPIEAAPASVGENESINSGPANLLETANTGSVSDERLDIAVHGFEDR
jgi:hypothetical protein